MYLRNLSKVRKTVEKLNIIDDTFFQKMAEDKEFCEEMLSTIMKQKIKILKVIPQNSVKNLQGRSVILDTFCELEDGRFSNIEVQKSNNDNHEKRVRYNASCITVNITEPGEKFEKIPDIIIIYITKFDMYKGKETVYHVDRVVRETGEIVDNGLKEVYVNTKIDDGSDIAELMKVFTEAETYNFEKFPKTSKRKAQFKSSEEGENSMCEIVEEFAKEYAKEYAEECVRETEENVARKLLKGGMAVEKIVEVVTRLTEEEVRALV